MLSYGGSVIPNVSPIIGNIIKIEEVGKRLFFVLLTLNWSTILSMAIIQKS